MGLHALRIKKNAFVSHFSAKSGPQELTLSKPIADPDMPSRPISIADAFF